MTRARLIRRLPEAEAIAHFVALYAEGKHKGRGSNPLAERFLGLDPTWVEVEIPHAQYSADWNTEDASLSSAQLDRAVRYAGSAGELPPGIATFTGKRSNKAFVQDGNHRAHAALMRGLPAARFYMPENQWLRFRERNS